AGLCIGIGKIIFRQNYLYCFCRNCSGFRNCLSRNRATTCTLKIASHNSIPFAGFSSERHETKEESSQTDEGGSGPSNPWPQRWYQWAQHQEKHQLSSLPLAVARAGGH
uniref:Uncharacterized protein n=1 Tax=Ficedula albicollis TaxID=59894 RepID=A0A803W9G5_FICAL